MVYGLRYFNIWEHVPLWKIFLIRFLRLQLSWNRYKQLISLLKTMQWCFIFPARVPLAHSFSDHWGKYIYMGGNFWNLLVEIEVYLLSVIPGLLWEGVFCMIYGNHHQSTLYCRDGRMKSETKVSSWSRVWPLALALITCPSLWYCLQKERQSLKVSKYHIDFQI